MSTTPDTIRHDYTDEEIKQARDAAMEGPRPTDIAFLRAFLAALPPDRAERPQPDEIAALNAERDRLAERVAVLQERNVDMENQRDQARQQADAELVKRRNFFQDAQKAEAEADQLRAEAEELRSQRDQLKAAVAELNGRLIERTSGMLSKQTELIQDARKSRSVARRALDYLDNVAQVFQKVADDSRFKPHDRSNMQGCANRVRAEVKPLRAELEAFDALPLRPNAAECGQSADSADNLRTGNHAPTPETDAHEEAMEREDFDVELALTYDLARRLERERDAARAEIEAMRGAIKNASHFASGILTEAGRQWQATQPLPDIASIEAIAQQIQDELQRFIKP